MQVTIVSAVPFDSAGAFWATKVENIGESAGAAIPHTNKKTIRVMPDGWDKKNGENMQQMQDNVNALIAIDLGPKRIESIPPSIHDSEPDAITIKEISGTFNTFSGNRKL